MAKICSICKHKKRAEIEAALVVGTSLRNISKQFGVGYSAVNRHRECISEILHKTAYARELGTVATVKEVLATLTEQMRFDTSDLFTADGGFDILEIKQRGLGRMLKSVTFKREANAGNKEPIDVVRVETHSQQSAAIALLNAYTKLEIARKSTVEQLQELVIRVQERSRAQTGVELSREQAIKYILAYKPELAGILGVSL